MLVELGGFRILVDTSPDLRTQLLGHDIGEVDAVIWTHDHADHCHGIDDVRQIMHRRGNRPVPGYARDHVLASLGRRFTYAFDGNPGYMPLFDPVELSDHMRIGPFEVSAVEMPHGPVKSTGLRFSDGFHSIGYATDFSYFTPDMERLFARCDVFVVDALRRNPHPTHAHLEMTLDGIAACGVDRAFLTHMDNSMDYDEVMRECPEGVEPAYDGLEVTVP